MDFFLAMMNQCASSDLIPSPFVKPGITVSHLLFADDVMVYSKASPIATFHLKSVLVHFRGYQ